MFMQAALLAIVFSAPPRGVVYRCVSPSGEITYEAAHHNGCVALFTYQPRAETAVSACSGNSRKCRAVCEAADELHDAASALANCAADADYSDDCDSQFSQVQSTHDDYESAVSDASGDCD